MMGEENHIGVLIELILTHVFPEACPDKLGERSVQYPDTDSSNSFRGVRRQWRIGSTSWRPLDTSRLPRVN